MGHYGIDVCYRPKYGHHFKYRVITPANFNTDVNICVNTILEVSQYVIKKDSSKSWVAYVQKTTPEVPTSLTVSCT